MPGNKPQIAIVASRGLVDLIRSQLPAYNDLAAWRLIDQPYDIAQTSLAELQRAGQVDAVVAAGAGADRIRSALSLPVSAIRVGGDDIVQALARASRVGVKVAIVTRRRLAEEFDEIVPVLNLDLSRHLYEDDASARVLLANLAIQSRPAVVGSSEIVYLAGLYNLTGVLIYSARAVRAALEGALELARVARLEEAKRERLDRILESLVEGVVAVDADERIQTINPAMARLIGLGEDWANGRRLTEIAPELSLRGVLQTGEARRDEIVGVAGKTLVTQRLPLLQADETVGAVLTFQDATAIERADRKLRAEARKSQFQARYRLHDVLGESPSIAAARELASLYAQSDSAVLIGGESGTGKELFAQGIHLASRRAQGPFVALNCAAFPESLLESELFGYEEGAFTGSRRGGKPGLIELAHQGTLFLDEIGDMPLPLQTRLLRVLQERQVLRLGGAEPTPVDVRVVAATHADLKARVVEGGFRADLYYRLNILNLTLPRLAERGADVGLLALAAVRDALRRLGSGLDPQQLLQPFLRAAQGYGWPGNVRELQNLGERLAVFLHVAGRLDEADVRRLAPELSEAAPAPDLPSTRRQQELQHIRKILAACGGDQTEAARQLGISRTTLWRRLKAGE
ncbi:propionate catabolism operon regulatory protein PrpR [Parachitinimonas caeni]|uniref:Propionate catabolism operon regulatory protein PrpR n=1 Tax=Parachitinimonas caeni TaxID=3031301 RepID=A0ABT7DYN9_9NEIS|nr:propionate catabolism operon regulatory protein PrpR [Parachitinimonas caeni]MDK2125178.1 propionate catabolism operon regulatory protein PrpR [Parachitinimonas caeni]